MEITLENEKAKAVISTHAAEILSFKRKDKDFEYIWKGDPAYWSGRNPILFPQVGSVSDNTNYYQGKAYPMGNHGFARNSEFTLEEDDETRAVLSLEADEKTLSQYPYHFRLKVNYRLEGTKLHIFYEIINHDKEEMPFGFGLHPAFSCPIDPEKTMEDYVFLFDEEEDVDFLDGKIQPVSHEFLDPDDKLIPERKSKTVTLTDGRNSVKVDCSEFKKIMLWSKPGAPFVCIEPLLFTQDKKETGVPFIDKKDVRVLKPGERFEIGTSYEFL